uniref:Transposase (Putative), gypsy type n=1 Tax=Tanacetum cinerariifolium TaxID=118510 RepID=A0A6L2P144_TANCI|nr:hypothetical protein [Tanacetum cinerariifolium]
MDWRTNAPKDGMPTVGTYSVEAMRALDMHHTPIQKQPEMLLYMVGISHRYYLGTRYKANCYLLIAEIDLFNLIQAPNPTKIDEPAVATNLSDVPSTIERSPLDFAHEARASYRGTAAPEMPPPKDVPAIAAPGAGQAEEIAATEPFQVATLQEQVSGEEKLMTAFEEFKRYEDERVEQRCMELDAGLDALSIDFDKELYPHILTSIAGRMWVIGHGLRLAMMKCAESLEMRQAFADVVSAGVAKGMSEGLKHRVEHGQAQLKLEGLKDAPMDVIMAALYLESDTKGCPTIYTLPPPQLLSAHHPRVSEVCRTYGVGSAHHARSDGVSVSIPTVVPQGLALLLVDAATQIDLEDT